MQSTAREIAKAGVDKGLGQYFAALTNMRSVGCMGDERTYDYAVVLRAVLTSDFYDCGVGRTSVGGPGNCDQENCQWSEGREPGALWLYGEAAGYDWIWIIDMFPGTQ